MTRDGGKPIMGFSMQLKQLFEICAFLATGYRDIAEPVKYSFMAGETNNVLRRG